MTWTRRQIVLGGATMVTAACKHKRATEIPEVWDAQPIPEQTAALAALAPPWTPPVRGVLENGLVTFWLFEPGTPALHVRLLLPTDSERAPLGPELVAILGDVLRAEVRRRLRQSGTEVSLIQGPDRIELLLRARTSELESVVDRLMQVLAHRNERALAQVHTRMRAKLGPADPAMMAHSQVVRELLGDIPQHIDPARLDRLTAAQLSSGWDTLADPHRAVLLVHSGRSDEGARELLRTATNRWHSVHRRDTAASAVTRLRRTAPPTPLTTRLLGEPAAPIAIIPAAKPTKPVLVCGRAIPTPTLAERTLARMAARLVAEELDASITIAGGLALFLVRHPISAGSAADDLRKLVTGMGELAHTRQPRQRLFTAASLWLGAQMVQNSLDGEDWTALARDALDLADSDQDVGAVLADHAEQLLNLHPDTLLPWTARWLDPQRGQPGWSWAVAGLEPTVAEQITKLASSPS